MPETLLIPQPQTIEGVILVLGVIGLIVGYKIVKAAFKFMKTMLKILMFLAGATIFLFMLLQKYLGQPV